MPSTGSSYASFVVRLSRAQTATVSVDWHTEAGTAEPGTDYQETSGTLVFAIGEVSKTIQVLLYAREPGDDDPRTFAIKLVPPPNVILHDISSDCVITATDSDGVLVASVAVAAGPPGISAYQLAVLQGYTGTPEQWLASLVGAPGVDAPTALGYVNQAIGARDIAVASAQQTTQDRNQTAADRTQANAGAASAAASRAAALSYAQQAQLAAQTAVAAGKLYATTFAGLAATSSGDFFFVESPDPQIADQYQNVGGVAVPTGKALPSVALLDAESARAQAAEAKLAGITGMAGPYVEGLPVDTVVYDKAGSTVSMRSGFVTLTPRPGGAFWIFGAAAFALAAPCALAASTLAQPYMPSFALAAPCATDTCALADPYDADTFALAGPYLDPASNLESRPALILYDSSGALIRATTLDGSAEYWALADGTLKRVDNNNVVAPFVEPATFDAGSSTVLVPAGSIDLPGGITITWPTTAVTSPATSSVSGQTATLAAGVSNSPLPHGYVTAYTAAWTSTAPAGRPAAPVEGTDFSITASAGFWSNPSAGSITLTYSASLVRKDLVTIDPHVNPAVPTLTQGTEQPRNGHLYPPAVPSGRMEIGRVTRKGSSAYFIPTWRYRDGTRVDRIALVADQRDRNRRILMPIISRLVTAQPVLVVADGNSRVAMGSTGSFAALNVHPNSSQSGGYQRDVPGFYAQYSVGDRAQAGYGSPVAFNARPGFNLSSGDAGASDGLGAVHIMGGYVWEMLLRLHAMYPTAPIGLDNFSIGGTSTADTISGDGRASALYSDRHNAVLADIDAWVATYGAGSVLYIPMDATNELGVVSPGSSYANWKTLATDAKAHGAVVHFMGLGRPDPRLQVAQAAAIPRFAADMARAAWETGSAISDGWLLDGVAELCGLGIIDDEMCDAQLPNHEGVIYQRAIGRDAAKSYA